MIEPFFFLSFFFQSFRNLSQLPNFALSIPLAMFHLSIEDDSMLAKADAMLTESLLMFPGVLTPLLDKCGVAPDQRVCSHAFFGPSAQSR